MIHETAIVEAGAEIGEGTNIWHHAHVRSGSRIGSGSAGSLRRRGRNQSSKI